MGYIGQTYRIPCDRGGLVHNPNIDLIEPTSMVHPSKNINIHENGRGKRGGTSLVYSTAFPNSPRIMGLFDYRLKDGSQFLIAATNLGEIYKDATTTIKTGMSTTNHFSFEVFREKLFICDGYSVPQVWDGVAASTWDLPNLPSDWTGTNFPKQFIKHGRGVSERLWAIGCPSTPYTVYASANGNGEDFSDASVVTLYIETGDGFGIVGAVEFGDRLICFGKRKAYIIDDSSPDVTSWGYVAAQWEGGVAHHRLIVKTPNDVICMTEDGEIYSISAAQTYGDYKAASLTRPAHIDRWIKEFVNLSYIDHFHAVYDPVLRAVKFFVVRNGKTQVDTALVYFIDRPVKEAWVVHDNENYPSGYSASCSAVVRKSGGNWKVYTGDYSGQIWELETVNKNDNGNPYYAGFRTPWLSFDNPRTSKLYRRGWLVTEAKGNYNVYINWWVDGEQKAQRSVSLKGTGATLDNFILDVDFLGGTELINKSFNLGAKGSRIKFEVYNSNVDEDFLFRRYLWTLKQH